VLKAGTRLQSQVDGTQVIVVKSPAGEVELACGGQPMIDVAKSPAPGLSPTAGQGVATAIGKRYVDADNTVEILVTKPGAFGLTLDGSPLEIKSAKPLPASD
jgi:hypothetical protein